MEFIDGRLTAQRYVDLILRPVVVPFIRQHNVTFQQDNTWMHVARLSIAFLQQNNVDMLRWPPYSPDLSIFLDILDSCVRRLPQPPTTLQALREALIQEFKFKHIYFTSIEKQVLTTYTNLSRFCFLGTTPVLAPNVWSNEKLVECYT